MYTHIETVVVIDNPSHDNVTWRTYTFQDDPKPVYVTITSTEQSQHAHHFTEIRRDGSATCLNCGAAAWCRSWVRYQFMGDNTTEWLDSMDRANMELVEQGAYDVLESKLDVRVIAAIDAAGAAKPVRREPLTGSRGQVPAMKPGLLHHEDYPVTA